MLFLIIAVLQMQALAGEINNLMANKKLNFHLEFSLLSKKYIDKFEFDEIILS